MEAKEQIIQVEYDYKYKGLNSYCLTSIISKFDDNSIAWSWLTYHEPGRNRN